VRPSGKAKTLDMKAHGARTANGVTVTATIATTHRPIRFQSERFFASRATSSAPKAIGHAVSFIAAARPRLIPAKLFCLRCKRGDAEQRQREDRHVVAARRQEQRPGRQREEELRDADLLLPRRAQQSERETAREQRQQ
jgi:nitroreductase